MKQPMRIKTVHEQILKHPDYKTKLDEATRWAFENGCVKGHSHCQKENNKWSRDIWNHLHLNTPLI